jgi:hypothetical protein
MFMPGVAIRLCIPLYNFGKLLCINNNWRELLGLFSGKFSQAARIQAFMRKTGKLSYRQCARNGGRLSGTKLGSRKFTWMRAVTGV